MELRGARHHRPARAWPRSSACRASCSCRRPSRSRPRRMWRCRSARARPSASRWSSALMTQALDVGDAPQGAGDRHRLGLPGGGAGAALPPRLHDRAPPRAARARPSSASPTLTLDNITTRFGDGTKGWPEQAPFDRIIVTAAAPEVPGKLLESLAPDGILVAPVGRERRDQQLLRVRARATASRSRIWARCASCR